MWDGDTGKLENRKAAKATHHQQGPAQPGGQGRKFQKQGHGKTACKWCVQEKDHVKNNCLARKSKCHKWKKVGHYATACKAKFTAEIEEEPPDEYYLTEVYAIDSDDFWLADLKVNGFNIMFKLDSGSKITVVGETTVWTKGLKVHKSKAEFRGPGGVPLSHLVLGEVRDASLEVAGRVIRETVYIMKGAKKKPVIEVSN